MTRKLPCRVERVTDHGHRVFTVTLRPAGRVPAFRPGQFLHLALDPYEADGFWPDSRAFSIASSPAERSTLDLCYSVRGRFTARMEHELTAGREVWIKMPYGEFVVDRAGDVVLLAGGTGISAFTAFLQALHTDTSGPVTLAYGARNRRLLVYRDLVDRCCRDVSSFHAMYFVEDGSTEPDGPCGDGPEIGRLSVASVWRRTPQPLRSSYYISGPPLMLQTLGRDLRERGVASEAIHIDAWE